jgi:hypothetical protein
MNVKENNVQRTANKMVKWYGCAKSIREHRQKNNALNTS